MGKDVYTLSKKVLACLLGIVFMMGFTTVAFSQDYPTKTITMVVGMEPGGIVDVASRVLSEEAKKVIGQDILVENRPGASHMVGLSYMLTKTGWLYRLRMLHSYGFLTCSN